jgi:hypothetical protein
VRTSSFFALAAAGFVGLFHVRSQAAVFASAYDASQTSGLISGYDDPTKALGGPTLIIEPGSQFQGILTPFDPPFAGTDLVGIGGGGQLTLQFPNLVNVGGGNEVGVFSNVFLQDADGSGDNSNPAMAYGSGAYGGGHASVYVSADDKTWFPISSSPATFDNPANGYLDATDPYQANPGNQLADFGIPFTHSISDFNGLDFAQTLALFGNSGGGTWLNLAGSGLSQIDYIQFRVPQGDELVVDAVSINNNDVGAAVPEPTSLAAIGMGVLVIVRRRC